MGGKTTNPRAWFKGSRIWFISVSLLALIVGQASAQATSPSDLATRLDFYFEHPNAPQTFRALAGLGDPGIQPDYLEFDRYGGGRGPDAELYQMLFPVPDNGFIDMGDCRPEYAVQTLKQRIATLGSDHPYVRRWVAVQRAVFSACLRSASDGTALPAALPLEDKALAKLQSDDRAYQAASLAFYQDDISHARLAFENIAQSASPQRAMAVYMVAAIQAGSRKGYEDGSKATVTPDQSIAAFKAIMNDPSLAAAHIAAREELGWVAATVADDATRTAQVRATLEDLEAPSSRLASDPDARTRYLLALGDIDRLHQASDLGDPAWWLRDGPPAQFTASRAMMKAAQADPMAAWVLFPVSYYQGRPWSPYGRNAAPSWNALRAYAEEHAKGDDPAAYAWMRVKHAIAGAYQPDAWPEIEAEEHDAARGDDRAAAALAFDFYHQVRLALSEWEVAPDRYEQALAELKAFPFKQSRVFKAARYDGLQYLMTVGRIDEARKWRDALEVAWTTAPGGDDDLDFSLLQILAEDPEHFAAAIPGDVYREILPLENNLSIASLRDLAQNQDLPASVKARFARVAWARTYALGRPVDAKLDKLMRDLNPTMVKGWKSPEGRTVRPDDHQVLLDVLRTPGLNIVIADVDRDPDYGGPEHADATDIDLYNHDDANWWCPWNASRHSDDLEATLKTTFFDAADLSLADGADAYELRGKLNTVLAASYAFQSQDPGETKALSAIPCAPRMLTGRVLDWVQHPRFFESREGQAEALALAIKTTRYGCYSDGPHGSYSKAAWLLLHQKFPTTPWAVRTKYWFN